VDNAYGLSLPPYMCIYSIVNLDNSKPYDPSILDREPKQVFPFVKDLTPDSYQS